MEIRFSSHWAYRLRGEEKETHKQSVVGKKEREILLIILVIKIKIKIKIILILADLLASGNLILMPPIR